MANLDVKRTTIQGREYTMPVMSGVEGRKVLLTLMRVMGPLAGAGTAPLGEVIVSVMERMDNATFEQVLAHFTAKAMVSGDEAGSMLRLHLDDTQNLVWCDNDGYLALIDFAKWGLEMNFGGFIAGLRARAEEAKKRSKARKEASEDQSESSSQSQ